MRPIEFVMDIFSGLFFLYAAVMEVIYAKRRKRKRNELRELDRFIVEVRHYYYQSGIVSWAVREAVGNSKWKLLKYLTHLCEMLEDGGAVEDTALFDDCSVGKYLKILSLVACSVEEYGDNKEEKDKSFLSVLLELRMDIKNEERMMSKASHLFMGFVITSVVPMMTMPAISRWACDTLSSLSAFYLGKVGTVIRISLTVASCFAYFSVIRLREGRDSRIKANRLEVFITGKTFIGKIIDKVIVRNYTRALRHTTLLKRLDARITVNILYLRQCIFGAGAALVLLMVYLDETVRMNFGVPDIVILVTVPVLCFFLPIADLHMQKAMSQDKTEEEIADLQMASSILSTTAGMNVMNMLEALEMFAVQLRPAITACINNFAVDDEKALEKLMAAEEDEHFERLALCLVMADDVGIEGAFAELSDDRKRFREYKNQENEYLLEDKSKLAMMLAILPGLLILFVYLLIPFMNEAMGLFDSYAMNLENGGGEYGYQTQLF